LIELLGELSEYVKPMANRRDDRRVGQEAVGIAFRIHTAWGLLSFFTTTTVLGTRLDLTLLELALECFYPADAATAELVRNSGGRAKTAESA
jgi:MmyB-like transcription regulator ligand binding domain